MQAQISSKHALAFMMHFNEWNDVVDMPMPIQSWTDNQEYVSSPEKISTTSLTQARY